MNWVLVKVANLIIVLIVVTFLVAAIFTGPLAERDKQNIAQTVRQSARAQFQNKPPLFIARDLLVRHNLGVKALVNETYYSAKSIMFSKDGQALFGNYDNQTRQTIVNTVAYYVVDAVKNKSITSQEQYIAYVTQQAYLNLTSQGIKISKNNLTKYANLVTNKLAERSKIDIIEDQIQIQVHRKGLDKPWYVLAVKYTKTLLTFRPLYSTVLTTQYWPYQGDRNALHIILERVPYSVLLFTTSSIFTLAVAMPLALYAARKPGSPVDSTITGWSVFSVSMPWWWLAMVFIYFFTVKYHIFPSPYRPEGVDWSQPTSVVKMAALPVFTVTVLSIGDTAYRMRNILLDVFNEDFVTVARAKGVPENMVLRKHVMRAAAPPLITIVVFYIVLSVFSGAIITELIFNWFGLGRLYWDALSANDVPVIVELTYITTLLYLIIRFILDILYTYLDPRIRRA